MNTLENRIEVYKLLIKSADISHTAKSIELHEKWCRLVIEEFFAQGDKEKYLGLQVSMYCDRETTNVNKSQAGFLKNIAMPLFKSLSGVLQWDKIDSVCLYHLQMNVSFWTRSTEKRNSIGSESEFEISRVSRRVTMPRLKKY